MDQMQVELMTCRLDEPVGQAGARAEERGFAVCGVVNQHGIVLGLIGKRDWDTDPTASAEQLMDSAGRLCIPILWKKRNRRSNLTWIPDRSIRESRILRGLGMNNSLRSKLWEP